MPLYEYNCKACDQRFETLVSRSAATEPQECPRCGKPSRERVLSKPASVSTAAGPSSSYSGCGASRGFS